MILKTLLLGATALACCAVPASAAQMKAARANPFAAVSTLPFHAPPFDKIKDSDYQPAIERGMAIQIAEMQQDRRQSGRADVRQHHRGDGKVGPHARTRRTRLLRRGSGQHERRRSMRVQTASRTEARRSIRTRSTSNPKLFARVKTLYDQRDSLRLTPEQLQVLTLYYQQFVHAGANLSDADKAKLRTLNTQISTLETAFQQKLLAAAKAGALVVDDKAKLAGMSDAEIAAAAQDAKDRGMPGKYVLPLQNTTQQPALASLTDRATREALFNAELDRAEKGDANDTRATHRRARDAARAKGGAARLSRTTPPMC